MRVRNLTRKCCFLGSENTTKLLTILSILYVYIKIIITSGLLGGIKRKKV